MERQTTPSIAGKTSLHKSLSPQKEKSRIAIKTTVLQSPINFTPNTCASAAERLVKNKKFALKFASSAFLRRSCTGPRQRPLAKWFHLQLWLVHLNLSASCGWGSCCQRALKFKWTNQSWGWNHFASGRCRGPVHERLRKAEEANFKANFSLNVKFWPSNLPGIYSIWWTQRQNLCKVRRFSKQWTLFSCFPPAGIVCTESLKV